VAAHDDRVRVGVRFNPKALRDLRLEERIQCVLPFVRADRSLRPWRIPFELDLLGNRPLRAHDGSDRSRALERALVQAQDDRPIPRSYRLDRTEGKDAAPPRQDGAPANDDLVWVVGITLVAHVVEPTELRPVACHHLVAVGGREEATELRLPPPAFLGTLLATLLHHGNEA
jgi:hypothetical protein